MTNFDKILKIKYFYWNDLVTAAHTFARPETRHVQ